MTENKELQIFKAMNRTCLIKTIRNLESLLGEKEKEMKQFRSELSKWTAPHEDGDLQEIKKQSKQASLSAKQAYINALEFTIKHREKKVEELEVKIANLEHDKELMTYGIGLDLMDKESLKARIEELEKESAKIKKLGDRVEELEDRILRMVRGEFKQICSYCGWESMEGQWEELKNHLKECPKHPLRKAEIKVKQCFGRRGASRFEVAIEAPQSGNNRTS